MLRRTLGWILLATLTSAPGVVRAQAGTGTRTGAGMAAGSRAGASRVTSTTAPTAPALLAERQRLKLDLDRINTEIDGLKRENRGLRDDYRLRNRMADAEALARRLTDLDARLRASGISTSAGGQRVATPALAVTPLAAAPEASPSDDRAVLEAKADILADQARQLNSQADLLATRVTQLRGRQELRRRAGQLEHDPFSALEQSKRRLASSGSSGVGFASPGGPPTPTSADSNGPGTPTTPPGGGAPALGPAPPMGSEGVITVGATGGPRTLTDATSVSGDKVQPSLLPPTSVGDAPTGSVATQFRGVLDPSTLAEIRRLEVAGSRAGNLPAMERALSALRARAAQLAGNASALRSRAKTTP